MEQADWDAPRTEEGLQQVLSRLEQCRSSADEVEIGDGLLALSFLVKWVRSDTSAQPFVRSHELALQALNAFRRAGNVSGQVRSLVAAAAMTDPETREEMLAEAERLTDGTGDEGQAALVLHTRARGLAMVDAAQAAALLKRALEIYRRIGNKRGQAQCLFSLAIAPGESRDKFDWATESATIYRGLGDRSNAARCVTLALMNAEETQPATSLEELAREGLEDALAAGDHGNEGRFYERLAEFAEARGAPDEAFKYRRWATEIRESDGLTPLQRWENQVDMTKMMISMAKLQGSSDSAKTFQAELKRLKAAKPRE